MVATYDDCSLLLLKNGSVIIAGNWGNDTTTLPRLLNTSLLNGAKVMFMGILRNNVNQNKTLYLATSTAIYYQGNC